MKTDEIGSCILGESNKTLFFPLLSGFCIQMGYGFRKQSGGRNRESRNKNQGKGMRADRGHLNIYVDIYITTLGREEFGALDRRMEGISIIECEGVGAPCGEPTPAVSGTAQGSYKEHKERREPKAWMRRARWCRPPWMAGEQGWPGAALRANLDVKRETQRASAGAHRVACFESPAAGLCRVLAALTVAGCSLFGCLGDETHPHILTHTHTHKRASTQTHTEGERKG